MAEAATSAAVESVAQKLNDVTLTSDAQASPEVNQQNQVETASYALTNTEDESYWGFHLHETYKMSVKFYKENEGKRTFDLSYEDKVYFAALTKQVTHGPYAQQTQLPEIGYLDMFGNDRRRVWETLEDISSNDARRRFIKHLQSVAPVFEPFMVAHQKQREEDERKRLEEERRQQEEERKRKEEEERIKREEEFQELERVRQEQERIQMEQKRQIMAALNEQTAQQFQQYAAQQFPGNAEQQAILIDQLQEQHYQQYMQLYQQQMQQQQQGPQDSQNPGAQQQQQRDAEQSDESDVSEDSAPKIEEPSTWTRPQIQEFKDQIKRDPESVITVGRGEVVTVRVPTHEEGAYVFWEFATDYYDIGFGVYFEWSNAPAQQVSVHVNETTDEEGSADEVEEEKGPGGDLESGAVAAAAGKNRPVTDEIVPIFRRECHTEVHAGSHRYPGRGVYLLKFDNSYSLWRSKTLYYRVYYTR